METLSVNAGIIRSFTSFFRKSIFSKSFKFRIATFKFLSSRSNAIMPNCRASGSGIIDKTARLIFLLLKSTKGILNAFICASRHSSSLIFPCFVKISQTSIFVLSAFSRAKSKSFRVTKPDSNTKSATLFLSTNILSL